MMEARVAVGEMLRVGGNVYKQATRDSGDMSSRRWVQMVGRRYLVNALRATLVVYP